MQLQRNLFEAHGMRHSVAPFRCQLLKWVGNKQRIAHEIASFFPPDIGVYREPFLGSGAVMATVAPTRALGSDISRPLIAIWQTLQTDPKELKRWYRDRWHRLQSGNKIEVYEAIKAAYNRDPNPADLLFISRACYGGVVRFRQADGHISTPCGIHAPISPESFCRRVDIWQRRVAGATFEHMDFEDAMGLAKPGDLVYCDPPYSDTQGILYGAQSFRLERLLAATERCKQRGVYVILSIDGTKKSGGHICKIEIPPGLFEREVIVNCGRSMLKRFQMNGRSLEEHVVADRLLLTF